MGPLSYGMITWVTGNDHRLAICATGLFFLLAIVVLVPLNVERGAARAKEMSAREAA